MLRKCWRRACAALLFTGAAAVALSGCTGAGTDGVIGSYQYKENGFVEETGIPVSDDSRAAWVRENMDKMLATEEAELYLGAYYDIAVIDLRSNQVFFSNEAIYRQESEGYSTDQQNNAFSQIVIDYFRKDGAEVTVTSFPECYDANGKEQIQADVSDGVLSVTYSFGTDMESRVIFQAITPETYEKIEALAEQAIADKTLKSSEWGRMKAVYNFVEFDKLSDAERKEYQEQFPSFTGGAMYLLNTAATYIQTDNVENVCKKLGLTREDVDKEEEKTGKAAGLESTVPNFVVTVEYRLDHADLLVGVELSLIREPENSYINRIYVLPSFGAADPEDPGYIFTPDGAGSLIYHDTEAAGSDTMQIRFYGTDEAEMPDKAEDLTPFAAFPVYGIKRGDSGLFAIVESNDAISGIDVQLQNQNYPQNTVMPWFLYRTRGNISNEDTTTTKNYVYSKKVSSMPYVIRYHFLYTDSSYNGMAAYYRSYLKQTGALVDREGGSRWGTDISIVGAIDGPENLFGSSSAVAASDYQSALDFIGSLGLEKISVNYEGLYNGGVTGSAPAKLKLVKALGSTELLDRLSEAVTVYPAVSFLKAYKSGNGIKGSSDIAKSIHKEYAYRAVYHPATGLLDQEKKAFLISPLSYVRVSGELLRSLTETGRNCLMLQDAASLLPSDFNEDNATVREESKYYLCESLSQLTGSGIELRLEGANVYALQYASSLTGIPVNGDKQRIVSSSVPFLGMVLHGVLPYSVAPLNEAENPEEAAAEMVINGALPSWRLITGEMSVLSDTDYTEYYSASAGFWTEEIRNLYNRLKPFYTAVAEAELVTYEELESGLVRISYSNGFQAYVNPFSETLSEGEIAVDGYSFRFFDSAGAEL